jgi:M6 family metalloprotease-like protein
VLVIPTLFFDSGDPQVTREELQRVLFDGPTEAGTLSEYFSETSQGQFTVEGTVTPWVRIGLAAAAVSGSDFGLGQDARTGDYLVQALTLADPGIDLGLFDNDGPDGIPDSGDDDGFVDALAVEFHESANRCRGQGPTIWGHRSRIAGWTGEPYVSGDIGANGTPIRANDYIVQPAVSCAGQVQTVTVIAHELGHILALPDLYDRTEGRLPENRSWVVGCWSVMAAGHWGCGPALAAGQWDRPTHFAPWEKDQLGWLRNVQTATDVLDTEYTLRPAETTGDVLRVPLSPLEHLFIEYRDGSGFDTHLPATGVAIYHVDDSRLPGGRRCRSCPQLYTVGLVEADANHGLTRPQDDGGNRGEAGDVFGSSGVTSLLNSTIPSSRLNSGAASDVSLYEITVSDGAAHIRLSSRVLGLERIAERFLGGGTDDLTDAEIAYLDRVGNADGRYDLGDLVRYLRDHPTVTARARDAGQIR